MELLGVIQIARMARAFEDDAPAIGERRGENVRLLQG